MRAVAVLGVEHDVLVFLDDVDDMQLDPQRFSRPQGVVALGLVLVFFADRVGVALDAKAGKKIHALDMHTLLHHHLGGEKGIEAAGDQGQCFALLGHRCLRFSAESGAL